MVERSLLWMLLSISMTLTACAMAQRGALDRAESYYDAGDNISCLIKLDQADSDGEHSEEVSAQISLYRGVCLQASGHGAQAIAVLDNLIRRFPNSDQAAQAKVILNNCTGACALPPQVPPPKASSAPSFPHKMLSKCKPARYPPESYATRETGTVTLGLYISKDGRPLNAEIRQSSGYPRLDAAAVQALSRCTFTPAIVDGQPADGWGNFKYTFSIDSDSGASRPTDPSGIDHSHTDADSQFHLASGTQVGRLFSSADLADIAASPERRIEELQIGIDRHNQHFEDLVKAHFDRMPGSGPGELLFDISVAPDGTISNCHLVSSTLSDATFETDMTSEVKQLNIGARSVPQATFSNYPFHVVER